MKVFQSEDKAPKGHTENVLDSAQLAIVRVKGDHIDRLPYSSHTIQPPFPSLLSLLKGSSEIFKDDKLDAEVFKTFINELHDYDPSYLTDEDGEAFYHFFSPYVNDIAGNGGGNHALHNLLQYSVRTCLKKRKHIQSRAKIR